MADTKNKKVSIEIDVNTDKAKKKLDDFAKSVNTIKNKINLNVELNTKGIDKSLNELKKTSDNVSKKMAQSFASSFDTTAKKVKNISQNIKKTLGDLSKDGKLVGKEFGSEFVSAIIETIKQKMSLFQSVCKTMVKGMAGAIRSSMSLINSAMSALTNSIIRGLDKVANKAKSTAKGMGGTLANALKQTIDFTIKANATSNNDGGKSASSSLLNAGLMASSLKTITQAAATTSMPKELGNTTAEFASRLIDAGRNALTFGKFAYQAYTLVRENWTKIVDSFKSIADKIRPVIEEGLQKAINSLSSGINKMMDSSNPLVSGLGRILESLRVGISNIPQKMNEFKGSIDNAIQSVIKFSKELDLASTAKALGGVVDSLWDSIKRLASAFSPYLEETVKTTVKLFESIVPIFGDLVGIVTSVVSVFAPLLKIVNTIVSKYTEQVKSISKVTDGLNTFMKIISINLVGSMEKFANCTSDIIKTLHDAFKGLGDKIWNWITGGKNNSGDLDAMKALLKSGKAGEMVKAAMGKGNSGGKPLTGGIGVGGQTNQGLGAGSPNSSPKADAAINGTIDKTEELIDKTEELKETTKELKQEQEKAANAGNDGILAKIKTIDDAIQVYNKFKNVINAIHHPFQTLKSELTKKIAFRALDGINSQATSVKDSFDKLRQSVQEFKNASNKQDKQAAGLKVLGDSARLSIKSLGLVLKANTVGRFIEKMNNPALKASKKLADKIPGGKDTIGFFKTAIGKISLLLGGVGLVNGIKTATQEAIKYESAVMQLTNRLGEAASKLNDFASNKGLDLGLSKTNIAEYGNIFSIFVSKFETDSTRATDTTIGLLEAASKTAQATGYDMRTVMDSFRSALTG